MSAIQKQAVKKSYQQRLKDVIPGGAHTYSRGSDQFPSNAPQILSSGSGVYVKDASGNEFLDFGMALRSVAIGYAEKSVNDAAIQQILAGNNLTRASMIELEAAERLTGMITSADMVKFTKNGSTAVSAAVKLARAYTGRKLILRCSDHPFFSFDDWFIGSTVINRGVPEEISGLTITFPYNDAVTLKTILDEHGSNIACLVMEAATTEEPAASVFEPGKSYLNDVEFLCKKHGIVFILDEMITGFRWHKYGAQALYGIHPDLTTFGKAMANGFSVAAVAGKRDIMKLGSIDETGQERVFLLSTTHGAEMSGLGAFVATMDFYDNHDVTGHMWAFGKKLKHLINRKALEHGLKENLAAYGFDCSPGIILKDQNAQVSMPLRTLFMQEMMNNRVMIPWISIAYHHGDKELEQVEHALNRSLPVLQKALNEGISRYLTGDSIQPVFRKYN
ncbi:MAG: glutamate-1-semialdehyde 2,1-aminomutase [Saccharospirillaceae bacterium]|nr:glutamate-1-semialdehyde 2,1-aminomutase [Saccharospirillaceae bacterium]MCD8530951.1 glutamate-1-semialdehyde 2,1-aminomutase [Saccharospirillaceae bacterium]